MTVMLENILLLLVTPKWLLRILPWPRAWRSMEAYDEYTKYMDEMLEDRLASARRGDKPDEGMDLMGQLARTAHTGGAAVAAGAEPGDAKKMTTTTTTAETTKTTTPPSSATAGSPAVGLTREEIIGNAFVMFMAGHETTANTLHFCMVFLATKPSAQRQMQRDIDDMVGDADPSTWDYEALVNRMTASMVGACINETLRLMPPAIEVPKVVSTDQTLAMDGRRHIVPRGTALSLAIAAVHQNPRYWPHEASRLRPGRSDLDEFRPERWFETREGDNNHNNINSNGNGSNSNSNKKQQQSEKETAAAEEEFFGGPDGPDTNAQLFRPERGAYIPFSDGARSCLGRRIAIVEMVAALAVVFREYSLELAVDEDDGDDDESDESSRTWRRKAYERAQERSRRTLKKASSLITLRLRGGAHVPVRLVRRGEERFVDWMDDEGSDG